MPSNAYNLAFPTGVARVDTHEYPVTLNNTPLSAASFNDIPIKVVGGATIYMRDVAQVRDGSTSQTTVVRRNGARGALVTLLKNGNASTLDIVNQVKALMPQIRAAAPENLRIDLLFDQSLFVTAAIEGVVTESVIAGLLTAAMILVFSRKLAEHADCGRLDSAGDPLVDRDAVSPGALAQRDDAGRARPGGGHSG